MKLGFLQAYLSDPLVGLSGAPILLPCPMAPKSVQPPGLIREGATMPGWACGRLTISQRLSPFSKPDPGHFTGSGGKDWADFNSTLPSKLPRSTDQVIGTGDGAETNFSLVKSYSSGTQSYERPITKPVSGSVLIAIDGADLDANDWSVDATTGIVNLGTPPAVGAVVTAGYEFDVPVRFEADRIEASAAGFASGEITSVPVIEVRR